MRLLHHIALAAALAGAIFITAGAAPRVEPPAPATTPDVGPQPPTPSPPAQSAPALKPGEPVNARCPVMDEEVDLECPKVKHNGYTVGFCCPGCDARWNEWPVAKKDAFISNSVRLLASRRTASAFLDALARGDAEGATALITTRTAAGIVINTRDEGSWVEFHAARLERFLAERRGRTYDVRLSATALPQSEVVRAVGTLSGARGGPAGPVALTIVTVEEDGARRIAHLHWCDEEPR